MFDRFLKLLVLIAFATFPASAAVAFTVVPRPPCPPVIDVPRDIWCC